MTRITVAMHELRPGDKFLDAVGTTVDGPPSTGSSLPQGYVEVPLFPGGITRFFGDVQIEVERDPA